MNQQIEELNTKLADIDNQITALNRKADVIWDEYSKVVQDFLSPLVGRCYKIDTHYVMVLDVPQNVWDETHTHMFFDPYRFRAMYIDEDCVYEDDLYAFASDYDDPVEYMSAQFEEISALEFELKLRNYFDSIRERCHLEMFGTFKNKHRED